MHPYNEELYNRIKASVERIMARYLSEPANDITRNSAHSQISGYLHALQSYKDIMSYAVNVNVVDFTLEVNVAYKEPNLVNAVNISLSLGSAQAGRFDSAMKGV